VDAARKRPGSIALLQFGSALLLAAAAVVGFYPLVRCPNCDVYLWQIPERCFRCKNTGQISLVDRWRRGDGSWVEWDGKIVTAIKAAPFANTSRKRALALLGFRPGEILTPKKREAAIQALLQTNDYIEVHFSVEPDPRSSDKVLVNLFVEEKPSARLDNPADPEDQ
jgi:hypothetical protein